MILQHLCVGVSVVQSVSVFQDNSNRYTKASVHLRRADVHVVPHHEYVRDERHPFVMTDDSHKAVPVYRQEYN